MHGGPRSKGWSNVEIERPDFRNPRTPYERHTTAWNWVSPLLRAPDGLTVKASGVRMLNAGLGALARAMKGERGYEEGDPLICPTTRLEIVSGGGCTNRHFWLCECGKRVAAVYQLPHTSGIWKCMKCAGYTYESLLTSGSGIAKNPARRLLRKKKLDPIIADGRPVGMRRSTYKRLKGRLPWPGLTVHEMENAFFLRALARIDQHFARKLEGLLADDTDF